LKEKRAVNKRVKPTILAQVIDVQLRLPVAAILLVNARARDFGDPL
jgi:hypothetical protein